jgi:peptidoglycan/LPS O-acetylase OafA/YrhL
LTPRRVAIAGCALLALAVALAPWFQLGDYRPDGWDATWWARLAALAAAAAIVAVRSDRPRAAVALTAAGLACVAFRAIAPPDFGFAFDGLHVPVERCWGLWVALAGAAIAVAGSALTAASARRSS